MAHGTNLLDDFRGKYNVGDIVFLKPNQPFIFPHHIKSREMLVKIEDKQVVTFTNNGVPFLIDRLSFIYKTHIDSYLVCINDGMIQWSIPSNENLRYEDSRGVNNEENN